ncbi:MAG: ACT domain-containing protein, partial [Actinomycetota bacterium]|nr:ACT domain-containing protein [Actinomycetota bacterium]
FDELTWTAALLSGRPERDPGSLVDLGIMSVQEYERLVRAAELTAAARWELQRAEAGPLLSLEYAEESALDLGQLQAALADTHHLLLAVRRRTDGSKTTQSQQPDPDTLFTLTRAGEKGVGALEELTWAGLLEELAPGMAELMTLRRPGLAHTLTVGAHCIKAACVIGEIGHRIDAGPVAARSASALTDFRVAVTAALMHDFGKCAPGPDHALRGVEQATLTAARLGLGPKDAESVGTLVRLHLLLIETATRTDLDDEDSVLLAAGRLGQREILPPLHLLSIADTSATGPGAWNEWTAALMGKLVTRLDSALSPDVDGAGIAASAELVRAAALAALPEEAHDSRGFVNDAPLRYLAGRELARVLEHAELVSELAVERAPGSHAVRIDTGPLTNTSQVTVATRDRHGLLAILAGVLALAGLDILSVEAIGTRSGVALDTFTVRSATLAPLSTDTWSRFDRLLDAALRGRLSIGVRLAERRRHYRDESVGVDRVDVLPGDQYAASIRIRANDRVGLLYDVTRAMADSGLEIRSVTATTRHKTADDVFRVTDANGAIPEEGLLGMLRMRLRELD